MELLTLLGLTACILLALALFALGQLFAQPTPAREVTQPRAELPSFLQRRPGEWRQGQSPVTIDGFDLAEDVLALTIENRRKLPEVKVEIDPESGDAALCLGAQTAAILRGAGPGFTLAHVMISHPE